jgi:hypothetical protein
VGSGEVEWDGVEWIRLAQDRYRWRTVVNTVVNLRVPGNVENFFDNSVT